MIVPLLKKGDVCSFHRLLLPFKYGGWWDDRFETESLETLLSEASVVIFNKYWGEDIIHLLQAKKKYGFKIVADIDDHFELYPGHVAAKGWKDWNMAQRIKESLMNADFVFTTTKKLATVVSAYNKNIEVVPNALPFGEEQFVDYRLRSPLIRFISAGGKTHLRDLREIYNCLRKLERKDRGHYRLVLAGYDETDKDGTWDKMEQIMAGNSPEVYSRVSRLPLDSYMEAFDHGDVVLAPLEPNYFNMFKSNLRVLEAGCKNMPIITSDHPPYSEEPTDLIWKAKTTNDWYRHMKNFINDPDLAIERGFMLGEYVRANYELAEVNNKRRQVFEYLAKK